MARVLGCTADRLLIGQPDYSAMQVRHQSSDRTSDGSRDLVGYGGVNTRNSLPSGSAMVTQLTSAGPTSLRVAPSETRRSTSVC
jgi:hypothetical protein